MACSYCKTPGHNRATCLMKYRDERIASLEHELRRIKNQLSTERIECGYCNAFMENYYAEWNTDGCA